MTEWISLERLLIDHSVAVLASVIESYGVMVWDGYGRRIWANDSHREEALELLAVRYAQSKDPGPDDGWYDIRELETRLYEFGWNENELPDFNPVQSVSVVAAPTASPSGLLTPPKRLNPWFSAIDAMAHDYYNKQGRLPTSEEAWHYLHNTPLDGFDIIQGRTGLKLLNKTMDSVSFKARWIRYTCG